jgi:hypothetical protein
MFVDHLHPSSLVLLGGDASIIVTSPTVYSIAAGDLVGISWVATGTRAIHGHLSDY